MGRIQELSDIIVQYPVETASRVRIEAVQTLSDDWYVLKKTTFQFQRSDGTWQRQSRETYDRGNGATILLYNLARGTVVLTRQFRFPAFVNGHDDLLIETPAGILDDATPEERIRQEVEEDYLAWLDHLRGGAADGDFAVRSNQFPSRKVGHGR